MSFPDPASITKLENLPVRARLIVEGALTGMHRARHHGSSVEFAEHKEYSPGDEIRHIDWKAYAKLDRYYVKQFEQESQLTVFLVLDSSGSMAYGDGLTKLGYASHLLAALAYLSIKQRDKVGLLAFGDETYDQRYIPPRARPAHLHDLLGVITEVNDRGGRGAEPAEVALERIADYASRRRSLVVLASDLFAGERALEMLALLRAQRHDVVLFHVLHPDEVAFPFEGLTEFESLEDERRKMLVNPGAVRRRYVEKMNAFRAHVRDACKHGGVDCQPVLTDQPFERTLLDFLTLRARAVAPGRTWSS